MELCDVYDKDRKKTGRTCERGFPLPEGDYSLIVHIWIQNDAGEYLISKRTPNKSWPLLWECTGGAAIAGDDSLSAALRETREELGIELDPLNGRMIRTLTDPNCFVDIWLFHQEVDLNDIVFQESETCDAMWAKVDDIRQMHRDGSFVPVFKYLEWLFALKETTVYFVRHAESDITVRQDDIRPLTEKGMADAQALVAKFEGIHLDAIYSSPYLRAEQTVLPLAKARRMPIYEQWVFRERKVGAGWIEDYDAFARQQWADHEYKLDEGESIAEVQRRNMAALDGLLKRYAGKSIVIGTHGGCLGAIRNHYDAAFGYQQFLELLPKMPCVVRMVFLGERCVEVLEL